MKIILILISIAITYIFFNLYKEVFKEKLTNDMVDELQSKKLSLENLKTKAIYSRTLH